MPFFTDRMKKLSDEFVLSVGMLLTSFLILQVAIIPLIYRGSQTALVKDSAPSTYGIVESKLAPGVYSFKRVFNKSSNSRKETNFDFSIEPFSDKLAKKELPHAELGQIRDAWNYPVRENAYMALATKGGVSLSTKTGSRGAGETRSDDDPENLGIVNCRYDTSVSGYFKAYFEDVALATGLGYDDPDFGPARRDEACQALQDISLLIRLNLTSITPDILFESSDNTLPSGALAGASTYFGYEYPGADNGALHRHILSGIDPRPGAGEFDAYVMTNWNGISWDVDSDLNPSTYDFYSVIYHEAVHALGFMGRLPAPVITTGDFHPYTSFNGFTFSDDSLTNPFISNGLLNAPVGAPSPWYVNNTDVYRGIKNVISAVPDGIRPVFSPTSWMQGSSLSHFDMERAPGEVYVMNRNIGPNTERQIHLHEKEVLCHIGYQVAGMTDCTNRTPVANPDSAVLSNSPVCINPLINDDSSSATQMYSLTPTSIQSGDQITYWSNAGCGTLLAGPNGAQSVLFTPVVSPEPRLLSYVMKFIGSTRLSFPTTISLVVCTNPEGEYVCNGDFEMNPIGVTYAGQYTQAFQCPSAYDPGFRVPYWCGVNTPDLATNTSEPPQVWVNLPFQCQWASTLSQYPSFADCLVDTGDSSHNTAFIYSRHFIDSNGDENNIYEEAVTELETPLQLGEQYIISFDYLAVGYHPGSEPQYEAEIQMTLTDNLDDVDLTEHTNFPEVIYAGAPIYNDNTWHHVTQLFTSEGGEGALIAKVHYEEVSPLETTALYLDNISIRRYDPTAGTITGTVYDDSNADGSHDAGEPGIPDVSVGIFHPGETTPFATTMTTASPDEGEYTFGNIPAGDYRVALMGENLYGIITEPSQNNSLPGYDHPYAVSVLGGQEVAGNDFGVNFSSVGVSDLQVKKSLIDGSLSIFDHNITWKIEVRNDGPMIATDISLLDLAPAPLLYYTHVTDVPNTYDPNTGIWFIPALGVDETATLQITMKVPKTACGMKTNIASIQSFAGVDNHPGDNTASAFIKLKLCPMPTGEVPSFPSTGPGTNTSGVKQ